MREIPANDDSLALSILGNRFDIENLACIVLHPREEDNRRCGGVLVNDSEDLFCSENWSGPFGEDSHESVFGVKSMPLDL